jgi:hypothetical protein
VDQDRFFCNTCELGVEKKLALCASCATTCHAGHDLVAHTKGRLTCVCGAQQRCEKLALGKVCAGHCVAVTSKPQLLFTCYFSCSCCKGCCCSIEILPSLLSAVPTRAVADPKRHHCPHFRTPQWTQGGEAARKSRRVK